MFNDMQMYGDLALILNIHVHCSSDWHYM